MFFKRMKRHDVTTTPIHISYSLTVSRVIITMAYSDIVTWCPMRIAMKGPERPWKAMEGFLDQMTYGPKSLQSVKSLSDEAGAAAAAPGGRSESGTEIEMIEM